MAGMDSVVVIVEGECTSESGGCGGGEQWDYARQVATMAEGCAKHDAFVSRCCVRRAGQSKIFVK